MAAIDKLTVEVSVLDANDTVTAAIYSDDGLLEYFEGVINVTANTTVRTVTNALTTIPIPRGNAWFCLGYAEVTSQLWRLRSADAAIARYGATFAGNELCPGGNPPATLAVNKTFAATRLVPAFTLTDE